MRTKFFLWKLFETNRLLNVLSIPLAIPFTKFDIRRLYNVNYLQRFTIAKYIVLYLK